MSNGTDGNTNFGKQDGVDLKTLLEARVDNVKTLIDANDKNYNQRFENVIQATAQALAASDRAVSKAETASEKRFDAVNEFRATLADQQRNLMPRLEVEIVTKGMNERIEKVENAIILQAGKGQGMSYLWGYIVGVVGVLIAIISLLIKFIE
jgi:UDP-N-acetylglucosamine transferase subunit ALG13